MILFASRTLPVRSFLFLHIIIPATKIFPFSLFRHRSRKETKAERPDKSICTNLYIYNRQKMLSLSSSQRNFWSCFSYCEQISRSCILSLIDSVYPYKTLLWLAFPPSFHFLWDFKVCFLLFSSLIFTYFSWRHFYNYYCVYACASVQFVEYAIPLFLKKHRARRFCVSFSFCFFTVLLLLLFC